MTVAELIENVTMRMKEVDAVVTQHSRVQPIAAQDYLALWHAVAFELAIAEDDE